MKTIAILLALINSLAACLVIAASLPSIQILRPAASLWNAAKVAVGIGIIVAGILTWVAAARATNQQFVFLAGLFLVSLGTASAVWTVHVALSSGNIKDYVFLFGDSLMAQGAASLWNLLMAGRGSNAL